MGGGVKGTGTYSSRAWSVVGGSKEVVRYSVYEEESSRDCFI